MAKNFVQEGKVINWTNHFSLNVKSGQAVLVGDLVGVAGLDIPAGESASVQLDGVWRLPKVDKLALDQGAIVYLGLETGLITSVPVDGIKAGYVFVAAEQTDTEVDVLLSR